MDSTGPILAVVTFLAIWGGHVGVRFVEARTERLIVPALLLVIAAGAAIGGSLLAEPLVVSAALGILGVTLLFDAAELYRQAKRIHHGHAPANPANPRHARLLAQGIGTTEALTDREPREYLDVPAEARS